MICPKCGKSLEQGARFCDGCGSPIQITTPQTTSQTTPQTTPETTPETTPQITPQTTPQSQSDFSAGCPNTDTSQKSVSLKTIILLIAGALTAIGVLFLTWIHIPLISTILDYMPRLFYGYSISTDLRAFIPTEYTLIGLGQLLTVLQEVIASSGNYDMSTITTAQGVYWLFLALSLCSVVLIGLGIIFRFLGKNRARALLLTGFIMAFVFSLIWCLLVLWGNSTALNTLSESIDLSVFQISAVVELGIGPILTLLASAFGVTYLLVAKETPVTTQ